jgi:exopolyphosphatase/guanosine-5'-triphosphate,3'-diphosphate pyrophosphatase
MTDLLGGHEEMRAMRRLAVIDLGSNSFRMTVFEHKGGQSRVHAEELREPVRLAAGIGDDGELSRKAFRRALRTVEQFAEVCRDLGVEEIVAVGTSAIRDAPNGADLVAEVRARTGIDVRILSGEEEAWYGYLAIANTTSISDGFGLELGGGSLQLTQLSSRALAASACLPLGAVRMTEAFLPQEKASGKAMRMLRGHVAEELEQLGWWSAGGPARLAGVGGTVRNLAAAVGRRSGADLDDGVQGFLLGRDPLEQLIEELAAMPAGDRGDVPGIKRDRGDVILAGALVVASALEQGGFDEIEVTQSGLREALFLEHLLEGVEPPLLSRAA